MNKEQMEKWDTKRLLAFKRKLHKCQPFMEDWEWGCKGSCCEMMHKQYAAWEAEMDMVKSILSTREHVVRPGKEEESRKRRDWHAQLKNWKKKLQKRYKDKK